MKAAGHGTGVKPFDPEPVEITSTFDLYMSPIIIACSAPDMFLNWMICPER